MPLPFALTGARGAQASCGAENCPLDLRAAHGSGPLSFALSWQYVRQDQKFFRPAEVDLLIGDPTKARTKLGWKPEVQFEELVRMMVDADIARLKTLDDPAGWNATGTLEREDGFMARDVAKGPPTLTH